ncbi:DUF4916 domain-containing protein [Arcanobacterium sp. S3PF19]|uniref:DUF4916 domain-containing protein n=1 Tax=Arcanobacterium sp. S3PF19 TaxID=1219585 RepID=UPI000554BE85|nr:DUF4916 domain-containing protein [Arcanobacterium sp. S3PF19]
MDALNTFDGSGPEGWLSPEELEFVRHKVPILYVDVVPVRLDERGRTEAVGLVLCMNGGSLHRSLVSGRVLFHETVRDAIARHIGKELGQMALPRFPPGIVPFTVGEYFPTPGEGLFDPRQHAVSLGYIIPMSGDCTPNSDAVGFSWFTPEEAGAPDLQAEMSEGQAVILRRALACLSCGR